MPEVIFKDVYKTPGALEILFALLKERQPDTNISHRRMPSWTEHARFVRSKPYRFWHFIHVPKEKKPVGAVYLSKMNEIGLFIFKKHRGKGRGEAVLSCLLKKYAVKGRLLANINPKNKKSIRFFQRAGFAHIQNTYEFRKPRGRK